jgi:hypothetical protein
MNKLGQYDNDERGNYSFNFHTEDGKHVNLSFRAEPDYDLDIIFQEFQNFLVASGHDVEGPIGELTFEEDNSDDEDYMRSWDADTDEVHAMTQAQSADKFSMDHFPNNGWPFGGLTTADVAPLTVTNLETNQTYAYKDRLMQNPTIAPLTSEQIQSWSLPTQQQINSSWRVDAPGTIGGAKVSFK